VEVSGDRGLAQVVLAAGRSERMGRPKALLGFGSETALSLVLRAGSTHAARALVVVGQELMSALDLSGACAGAEVVVNPRPQSEQLDSLQLALEALSASPPAGFFVHPADFPLVSAGDYALLAAAFRDPSLRAFQVFVPSHSLRRGHPLLCRWQLARAFLELPPGATARDVVARHAVAHVETPNRGVIEDMDTPEAYERLLARYTSAVTP
jgi:molybdenum cofactor cytidylyltransferase